MKEVLTSELGFMLYTLFLGIIIGLCFSPKKKSRRIYVDNEYMEEYL